MSPSDPTPVRSDSTPVSRDGDALLDLLRGELSPRRRRMLEQKLAGDPRLQAELERLERFLNAARGAREPAPDPVVALRIATRVRDQVAAEEQAARRPQSRSGGRRLLWGRVLAVSVAVHVVVLAVLAVHLVGRRSAADASPRLRASLPTPGLPAEDLAFHEVPAPWGSPLVDPEWPLEGRLPEPPPGDEEDLALVPLADMYRDHPRNVALEMVTRRVDGLKRRQLRRLGLDASGTLEKLAAGLRALEKSQRQDGSFPPGGGRGDLGQTALALLPFLGDGHGSQTGTLGPLVVAPGVAWVRGRLFEDQGRLRPVDRMPSSELGMALKALCEDYQLSYGHLAPGDARRRRSEIRSLSHHVAARQQQDGSIATPGEAPRAAVWPLWALDAAARTGVVAQIGSVAERFHTWCRTEAPTDPHLAAAQVLVARNLGDASRPEARQQALDLLDQRGTPLTDPLYVAVAGTGLLLYDPSAFRAWNGEAAVSVGDELLERLSPTGVVWKGDPVGDTALHLLALQVAYRTY